MKTVDQVITRFRRHYPNCDATTALDLFQTAYKRLLDKAGFRRTDVNFTSIVQGTREYDWAEADIRIYGVTWYKSATSWVPLTPTTEDQFSDHDPDWKDERETIDSATISSATLANPCVITTSIAHGYSTNDLVTISSATGLTEINGDWTITVLSTTTFSIPLDTSAEAAYDASSATVSKVVAKQGTPCKFYLASRTDSSSNKTGKLVIGFYPAPDTTTANGYPFAVCHCEEHSAISGSTTIPYSVLDEMYFVYAMCEFWAYESDVSKATLWERKRISEETVQIEHLKNLMPTDETTILPPRGVFSTPIT